MGREEITQARRERGQKQKRAVSPLMLASRTNRGPAFILRSPWVWVPAPAPNSSFLLVQAPLGNSGGSGLGFLQPSERPGLSSGKESTSAGALPPATPTQASGEPFLLQSPSQLASKSAWVEDAHKLWLPQSTSVHSSGLDCLALLRLTTRGASGLGVFKGCG